MGKGKTVYIVPKEKPIAAARTVVVLKESKAQGPFYNVRKKAI